MSVVEHRFGPYGGQYVPETLMPALAELESAWVAARADPRFAAPERFLGVMGSRSPNISMSAVATAPRHRV